MADEYNCNSCGKLTDIGYFYCENCHRMHKEQKRNKENTEESNSAEKQLLYQIVESEPKQL